MFKIRNRFRLKLAAAYLGLLHLIGVALASTTTLTFTTQITLAASCVVNGASTLNFGSTGALVANVDQTATISLTCTDTTPFTIGLGAGTGSGATVAVRKMTGGGAAVNYSLYSDSARTTVWGNTIGTDTVASTGNGAAQNYTVYGHVRPRPRRRRALTPTPSQSP